MSGLTFTIRGQTVAADDVAKYLAPAKKRSASSAAKRVHDRSVAKISMGFIVQGYSPEQMAQAQETHQAAIDSRNKLAELDPVAAMKEKAVPPWCADTFMNKTKPKRVRSKPYELSSAADACKALAEKSGWLRVTVEELMKA